LIANSKKLPKAIFVDGMLGTDSNGLAKGLTYRLASELEVIDVKDMGVHRRRPATVMHVDPFEKWQQADIIRLRKSMIEEDDGVLHMAWGAVHSAARQIDTVTRQSGWVPDVIVASNWLGFFQSLMREATKLNFNKPVNADFNKFLEHPFLDFAKDNVVAINAVLSEEIFNLYQSKDKTKDKTHRATYETEAGYLPIPHLSRFRGRENVHLHDLNVDGYSKSQIENFFFDSTAKIIRKLG
jgi:hypothetical protein